MGVKFWGVYIPPSPPGFAPLVSKLQNYRGQMVEKRLDLRCELWGETNMVKEKVVKEKVVKEKVKLKL